MDEQICYYNDGVPVTVADVAEMARHGETTQEICPECDNEVEIPVTGGHCPECGKWVIPCSMCDTALNCLGDDRPCPYECFRPKDEKERENMSKLKTCNEMCPECGAEITIPVVGGRCPECGHWAKPCNVCHWSGADCKDCPYKEGDTVAGYLDKALEKVNEALTTLYEAETPYYRATLSPLDNEVQSAIRTLRSLRDSIESEKPTVRMRMYKIVRYRKDLDVPADVANQVTDDDASALDEWLQDHPQEAEFDVDRDYDCTLENWSEVL